ncbi:MAG: serine O-acetyltransferase [Alphaproteobacteria bacterium]
MIFKKINTDLNAFLERDPAAPNKISVILLWPGFHAIVFYRLSHWFWKRKYTHFIARLLSGMGRFLTSVDIHPGAQIGEGFVIDHATGVVIGETAIIGDNVTLYHNVTLGGVSPSINSAAQVGVKRHPTIRDNVIIGSGASVLGDIIVDDNARIGANAVVTKNIPANTTAVGNPARIIGQAKDNDASDFRAYGINPDGLPDVTMQEIILIKQRLEVIEQASMKKTDEDHQNFSEAAPLQSDTNTDYIGDSK